MDSSMDWKLFGLKIFFFLQFRRSLRFRFVFVFCGPWPRNPPAHRRHGGLGPAPASASVSHGRYACLARCQAEKLVFERFFQLFEPRFIFRSRRSLSGEAAQNPANGVPSPLTLSQKGLFAASAVRLIQSA